MLFRTIFSTQPSMEKTEAMFFSNIGWRILGITYASAHRPMYSVDRNPCTLHDAARRNLFPAHILTNRANADSPRKLRSSENVGQDTNIIKWNKCLNWIFLQSKNLKRKIILRVKTGFYIFWRNSTESTWKLAIFLQNAVILDEQQFVAEKNILLTVIIIAHPFFTMRLSWHFQLFALDDRLQFNCLIKNALVYI